MGKRHEFDLQPFMHELPNCTRSLYIQPGAASTASESLPTFPLSFVERPRHYHFYEDRTFIYVAALKHILTKSSQNCLQSYTLIGRAARRYSCTAFPSRQPTVVLYLPLAQMERELFGDRNTDLAFLTHYHCI
jgi:hypothetical protein